MSIKNFFNQIDDTARSKEIEQQANEAKDRFFTETTIEYANKIIEVIEVYIPEFEKRGFRCVNKTGNLPYWHFVVTNPKGTNVKIAIVNGHENRYEIAFYHNEQRLNAPIFITNNFDRTMIETELQNLFKKLV